LYRITGTGVQRYTDSCTFGAEPASKKEDCNSSPLKRINLQGKTYILCEKSL
jgi:hypothetical protein